MLMQTDVLKWFKKYKGQQHIELQLMISFIFDN